mmetsp:Transcript_41625/g.97641  ORF Transcript_41625/g.97641 Transcript_41625/m.97641 type:complete len:221 (-) Transcript_41625:654-1316(-)
MNIDFTRGSLSFLGLVRTRMNSGWSFTKFVIASAWLPADVAALAAALGAASAAAEAACAEAGAAAAAGVGTFLATLSFGCSTTMSGGLLRASGRSLVEVRASCCTCFWRFAFFSKSAFSLAAFRLRRLEATSNSSIAPSPGCSATSRAAAACHSGASSKAAASENMDMSSRSTSPSSFGAAGFSLVVSPFLPASDLTTEGSEALTASATPLPMSRSWAGS